MNKNKDVIYIEPEDDITDIITKIENSKQKIVALVPPKKAAVLRSLVNIKLIAKAGMTNQKTVVLVTTDSSIIKLAAAAKLPITKSLSSAPVVPELDKKDVAETTLQEKVDEGGKEVSEKDSSDDDSEQSDEDGDDTESDEDTEEEEEEEEEEDASEDEDGADSKDSEDTKDKKGEKSKDKKAKKSGKKNKLSESNNPILRFIGNHPKTLIFSGIGAVVLVVVLVWAFAIAPAATVTITLRTVNGNFSENVTFTEKLQEEDANAGKFYLEQKKIETKVEVEFEPTGKKNVGEKAKGTVVVYTYLKDAGSVPISEGSKFTNGDLTFVSTEPATLTWDGKSFDTCDNKNATATEKLKSGCQMSARVKVEAVGSGAQYNIAATSQGWITTQDVGVYSDSAMSGGTDKTVTVVQQSDVVKALAKVQDMNENQNRQKLLDSLGEDAFVIDSSFSQTTGEAVTTPKVDEVVEDGKKAKLSVITTDSIFVIDEVKVKEFITEKAKLASNFKIYEMNDPFIENFTKTESGYTGKLKTSYVSGPKMTENDVINVIRGKGLGTAQHDLNAAYGEGIKSMNTKTSFPWVMTIPNDPDKITVIIQVDEA